MARCTDSAGLTRFEIQRRRFGRCLLYRTGRVPHSTCNQSTAGRKLDRSRGLNDCVDKDKCPLIVNQMKRAPDPHADLCGSQIRTERDRFLAVGTNQISPRFRLMRIVRDRPKLALGESGG